MDGNPCLIPVNDSRKEICSRRHPEGKTLKTFNSMPKRLLCFSPLEYWLSGERDNLLIHWVCYCKYYSSRFAAALLSFFSFSHVFVRASSLVWVKQTGWIEQTGCISCDWQMNIHPVCDERRRPTEYVIVSPHVCVFSQQLRLWFRVFRHCKMQQQRDYGLLLGNSLQIASMSLDWLYCPCGDVIPVHIGKHAHTWAQVCTRAHPPTHIQTETPTLP